VDHLRILKRALSITRSYRALWVFGILLALTTGGRGSGNGGGRGGPGPIQRPEISPEMLTNLVVAGIVAFIVLLLLVAVGVIVRYVSETALIRMVAQHEATGVKVGVRQGFRLGWSRAALRLFWMDLLIGLVAFATFFVLVLLAASPLLVWLTDSTPARVLGTVVAAALAVVILFLVIVASIALWLLGQFWHRAVVLEDQSVRSALRRGWQLLRQRLGDVLVMGLILFGLGLAWTIVLVPLIFLLVAVAAIGGGLPALLVYSIGSMVAQGAAPWVAAILVGLPIFIVILAIPLAVLGGLAQTFQSSTWTLTYRELLALEATPPALEGSDLPPAPLPAA
jgi:hypothetical protein